jgi:Golgi nucleoside diphosphatase
MFNGTAQRSQVKQRMPRHLPPLGSASLSIVIFFCSNSLPTVTEEAQLQLLQTSAEMDLLLQQLQTHMIKQQACHPYE